MVVLIARYFIKPGNSDQVVAALQQMAPLVKAHEPGCLLYHANRSRDNEHVIVLYEQYRDMAALEAHRETPHFKELIEGRIIPLLERREREICDSLVS